MSNTPPTADELLARLRDLLEQEGISIPENTKTDGKMIESYVLPALENSQNVLADLYTDIAGGSGSFKGLKQKLVQKIASVSRNTMEKSMIRQQRYNEMMLTLVRYLYEQQKAAEKDS